MPIFKVTVTEKVTRICVAYVDAADSDAADKWSGNAPDHAFREVGERARDAWAEVESIEQVDAAPEGWKIRTT